MVKKNKKKRNKTYTGIDAAPSKATVTRIEAVSRNKVSQWWFDNKKIAKPVMIALAVVAFTIMIVAQIIQLIKG